MQAFAPENFSLWKEILLPKNIALLLSNDSVTGCWFSTDLLDKKYVHYCIMWYPNREIFTKGHGKKKNQLQFRKCTGHVQMPSPEVLWFLCNMQTVHLKEQ